MKNIFFDLTGSLDKWQLDMAINQLTAVKEQNYIGSEEMALKSAIHFIEAYMLHKGLNEN